jgi:uncharacterized protein (TIGR03086 family)
MTTTPDLHTSAGRLATVVRNVRDDQLDGPTPCPAYSVGDLLDHIGGFALAFRAAAEKDMGDITGRPPVPDGAKLEAGWRDRIGRDLDALAGAWDAPEAWDGMTRVGGIDLPGASAGAFALDEIVVHGWDLARATDQPYACDDDALQVVHALAEGFAAPEMAASREGLFGPVVVVDERAPMLPRVIGLTGRDPDWSAP